MKPRFGNAARVGAALVAVTVAMLLATSVFRGGSDGTPDPIALGAGTTSEQASAFHEIAPQALDQLRPTTSTTASTADEGPTGGPSAPDQAPTAPFVEPGSTDVGGGAPPARVDGAPDPTTTSTVIGTVTLPTLPPLLPGTPEPSIPPISLPGLPLLDLLPLDGGAP